MSKKFIFSNSKKMKVISIVTIIVIGVTLSSIYKQHQSDKNEQVAIVQQKNEYEKTKMRKRELDQEVQQKKLEEQKVLDEEKRIEGQRKTDEEKINIDVNNDSTFNEDTKDYVVTKENAIEIVRKITIGKNLKVKIGYDHVQKRDDKDYHVVRVYDDMADHISTLGWYYVQVDTGKTFEWDLVEDKLIPIE